VDLEEVLDQLFTDVIPYGYNTSSPGFLGYFGGGGIPHSAAADLISGTVNRFIGRWVAAPGAVQLEAGVVQWFQKMVGYPDSARGTLTSGGSQSNQTALFTARQAYLRGKDLRLGRIYASDQTHFSLSKSALICGLPNESIRYIPSDDKGCLRVDLLEALIEQDRRNGYYPFLIFANGGTFTTGAVDDLQSITAIAKRQDVWVHVDAAYGGFFTMTKRGRKLFAGLDQCDSITLDPHKSLFLPYGTGALIVREGERLKHAHEIDADFYGPIQDDPCRVDFCSYSTEQTREWRGLRIWLPLMLHGITPFEKNLEEKLLLTDYASKVLRNTPGIELVFEPTLSVLAFRLVKVGLAEDELKQLNQQLLKRINDKKNVFLMLTTIKETYCIRFCALSFRTHFDRVDLGLKQIKQASAELLVEWDISVSQP
jgi:aromatic-L-amino-acid decarboxylase